MVPEQITAVQEDVPPRAVRIGMLTSAGIDAGALGAFDGPVVLDPVMVAKSGDALLDEEAGALLIERLLPRVNVLTPHRPEAARLLGQGEARDTKESQVLLAKGPRAASMKGGDAARPICIDWLVTGADVIALTQPWIATRNTHGTGRCLSTAISAELATGAGLGVAVRRAQALLHGAIRAADGLGIRRGHGPVHHFHGLWS